MVPSQRVAPAPRRGFTLVELMVVLTIIAILGAAIVPQFAGTRDDLRLRTAGRELMAASTLAYSLAVGRQVPHRLVIDPAEGRWLIEAPPAEASAGGEFAPVLGVPGTSGRLEGKLAIEVRGPADGEGGPRAGRPGDRGDPGGRRGGDAPPEAVLFRPDGTADPREIVLRDREGFGIALRVDPVTSRVRARTLEREIQR
jgi:prepilin-type N-terminal cleavage/methylation domain-containing protein